VQIEIEDTLRVEGAAGTVPVTVRNTGGGTDLYRVSADAEAGWTATLTNALVVVQAGQTATVRVHIARENAAARSGTLRFTATSESDGTKKASATAALTAAR
jgi:hypothetical protein